MTKTCLVVGALSGLALGLRMYGLDTVPGMHDNEGSIGVITWQVLQGTAPPPYGFPYMGVIVLDQYVRAGFLWLFGPSVAALRMMSVLYGMTALMLLSLLAARHMSRRIGLLTLAAGAALVVHVHFSRLALPHIGEGVFWIAAALAMLSDWWFVAGLLGGFGALFYASGPFVWASFVGGATLVFCWKPIHAGLRLGLGSLIGLYPLLHAWRFEPLQFANTMAHSRAHISFDLGTFSNRLLAAIHPHWHTSIGDFWPMERGWLPPLGLALLCIGLLTALWRSLKAPAYALVLVWYIVTFFGLAWTSGNHALRFWPAMMLLPLFLAVGLDVLRYNALIVSLLCVLIAGEINFYFRQVMPSCAARGGWIRVEANVVGRAVANGYAIWIAGDGKGIHHGVTEYFGGPSMRGADWRAVSDIDQAPARTAFLVYPERAEFLAFARSRFPQGRVEAVTDPCVPGPPLTVYYSSP